jgi:hypothetical protein
VSFAEDFPFYFHNLCLTALRSSGDAARGTLDDQHDVGGSLDVRTTRVTHTFRLISKVRRTGQRTGEEKGGRSRKELTVISCCVMCTRKRMQ